MPHIYKKSLGQNFLINHNILKNITDSINISEEVVLEIGPGSGNLTHYILKNSPKHIFCIEKDKSLIENLKTRFKDNKNITIINQDIMDFNIYDIFSKFNCKITVIANLPYNIGTVLLLNWLKTPQYFNSMTVMLQKEVASRICAKVGDSEYARISILFQYWFDVKKLFDVSAGNFYPVPKVTSSVIKLMPKYNIISDDSIKIYLQFDAFLKEIFTYRRKTLGKILKNDKYKLEQLNIPLQTRPEELSSEKLLLLFKEIKSQ
jgi:16S rRNA (adenine1518-N6/adenine1519-N6)-dimethyltransferase